jgi:hypothetical protein
MRVTREELDVLEAAAHLSRTTPNAYVYGLLQAHTTALASDEFVQRDLANRRQFEQQVSTTTRLTPRAAALTPTPAAPQEDLDARGS